MTKLWSFAPAYIHIFIFVWSLLLHRHNILIQYHSTCMSQKQKEGNKSYRQAYNQIDLKNKVWFLSIFFGRTKTSIHPTSVYLQFYLLLKSLCEMTAWISYIWKFKQKIGSTCSIPYRYHCTFSMTTFKERPIHFTQWMKKMVGYSKMYPKYVYSLVLGKNSNWLVISPSIPWVCCN